MNEDIKILREALAKYAEFVEVDDGDPMEVPYRLYQKANTEYRQACDPDRIRRLLDDADRIDWLARQFLEDLSMGIVIDAPNDGYYYVRGDNDVTGYGKTFREAIDQARKA